MILARFGCFQVISARFRVFHVLVWTYANIFCKQWKEVFSDRETWENHDYHEMIFERFFQIISRLTEIPHTLFLKVNNYQHFWNLLFMSSVVISIFFINFSLSCTLALSFIPWKLENNVFSNLCRSYLLKKLSI